MKVKIPPIVLIILSLALFFGVKNVLPNIINNPWEKRFSIGNKVLIKANLTDDKQMAIKAFQQKDYEEAIAYFKSSLKQTPNDPETLIYLNNSQAQNNNPLRISVVVPISSNLDLAQEMLRGVAMAQNKINKNGGIKGRFLEVEIIDDENNPEITTKVAEKLVKDQTTLAVIGSNASVASLAGAQVYQENGLVMITPTSFTDQLTGFGSYIFRTIPSIENMSKPLVEYAAKTTNKGKTGICFDSRSSDQVVYKNTYIKAAASQKMDTIDLNCDFANPDFNPQKIVADAVSNGVKSLLLSPAIAPVNSIDQAIQIAQANQGRLILLGSTTLYTYQTLQSGSGNGLVVAAPWHPSQSKKFADQGEQLWGGQVNWRTATSYDATLAIAQGLEKSQTRDGLQEVLRSQSFVVFGGSGSEVKFDLGGDRIGEAILLKIQPSRSGKSVSGLEFAPIKK